MNLDRPLAPNPNDLHPAPATFVVTSTDLVDGQAMPAAQVASSAGGENRSPQLSWSGAPAETQSYVVTCFDPDAPTFSGFWHWLAGDIPATVTELAADAGAEGGAGLPEGAVQLRNDGGANAYMGAAPPPGDRVHRYIFTVHALNEADLELESDDAAAFVSFAALDCEIARATLTVTYQR
ncbi:YbhB/YbcL family Raf kinase inhibitor-like protein [Luteipulveratus mongoliensis]|uniref:PEBP family protein n=1 Tax=Luteipulveratus mongoliensis TaxID=571913 RepID=A0A0K1JPN9_9MICO|nr:YbhB/YbcL family Raf kinase inhibitor-like protein [Luteipulveratus mongoliensis]AKU18679.1 PEBP family protein [Luteipulveratus mongoliensis]